MNLADYGLFIERGDIMIGHYECGAEFDLLPSVSDEPTVADLIAQIREHEERIDNA